MFGIPMLQKMHKPRYVDLFIYMLTGCFVVWFKLYCNNAGNQELLLFLKPLAAAVGIFTGISFEYGPAVGFYNEAAGIVIGKSCAGVNFYMILLLMLVFSFIARFRKTTSKVTAFVLFLALSYIGTVFVNISRVIGAIRVLAYLRSAGNGLDPDMVHKAAGILCFSFFLMIIYYFGNRLIKEGSTNHEATS